MAGDVAGEIAIVAVPAAIGRRLRLESGALAVEGEHAVGLEGEQILRVEVLRLFQRTARQAYRAERQRTGDVGDGVGDAVGAGLRGQRGSEKRECKQRDRERGA